MSAPATDMTCRDQEAQWKAQTPFNERIHETMTTISRELQTMKADIRSLKTEMNHFNERLKEVCEHVGLPPIERKKVRSKRSVL
jgi:hypothetical protein